MKQWLKWLGYIVIVSQIFMLNIPLLSTVVAGYTIKYILFYGFILAVNVLWWLKKLKHRKVNITDFALMMLLLGPYLVGLAWGWSLRNIILESVLILMPIYIYQWIDLVDIRKEEYLAVFSLTNFAACIVSVLVALRIIDAGIWAAEGVLVRSAGAVDSTLGIGGVSLALVVLYVYPENSTKREKLALSILLLSGVIITFFSQSRTRIALVFVVSACVILYNIINRKSKFGSLRFFLLIAIAAFIIISLFPELVSQILNQIVGRYENLSNDDGNVLFRENEASLQIAGFLRSPLFGLGWGSRSQYDDMYCHNLYTTVLMQGGLVFGGIYIVWFLSYLYKSAVNLLRRENLQSAMIATTFMLVLVILGFTNSGIVQSSGYFMMGFVILDDKIRKENRDSSRIAYADRYINIP